MIPVSVQPSRLPRPAPERIESSLPANPGLEGWVVVAAQALGLPEPDAYLFSGLPRRVASWPGTYAEAIEELDRLARLRVAVSACWQYMRSCSGLRPPTAEQERAARAALRDAMNSTSRPGVAARGAREGAA